jgi:hypothetical protein
VAESAEPAAVSSAANAAVVSHPNTRKTNAVASLRFMAKLPLMSDVREFQATAAAADCSPARVQQRLCHSPVFAQSSG